MQSQNSGLEGLLQVHLAYMQNQYLETISPEPFSEEEAQKSSHLGEA